jgi:DNA-binding NtrC family response regulator
MWRMARILIVEDEPLIALMLEDWLVDLGHAPVGPAAAVNEALVIVSREKLDGAIVDFHLRQETAELVAQALEDKNVPFVFASGVAIVMTGHAAVASLDKPYDFEAVSLAVQNLVAALPPASQI